MLSRDLSLPIALNPFSSPFQWFHPNAPSKLLQKTLKTKTHFPKSPKTLSIQSISPNPNPQFSSTNPTHRRNLRSFAGRSKKKPGQPSTGRIEGNADVRREAKKNARRKSKKLAESLFYRLKNPSRNHADNFTEDELEAIGLGYDRMVRFMDQDDPNLRHPYDWYKYGEFGPYSWRGLVLGDPIRGRFSDENVTLIGEVRDHEEWEKIEQFEMASDFSKRLEQLDKSIGFRHFWVFVRHPRWRITELPWQQWTLVCEVVLEVGKEERLDKWNLMGRIGNKSRALITQCAAWMRPDIIYVKRPVYQCRFEPQSEFFKGLAPLLDPKTEGNFLYEVKSDDGRVELCTYFGGLCKIVRVNPKAFVDDVVKAYMKLSDEKKSKCLEFLLSNHPAPLLHPYTKEWKAKLEEMELGCDAPDGDDDEKLSETQVTDWIEIDDDDSDDDNDVDYDGDDDSVVDIEDGDEDELGIEEEGLEAEEDEKFWEEQFEKALSSSEGMEKLAKRSVEKSTEFYKRQLASMEKEEKGKESFDGGDEMEMRGRKAKVSKEEWRNAGYGPRRRRIRSSKIPPELFLRAAVRPFTYRNLVKEIVLMRHAILDGDIGGKD